MGASVGQEGGGMKGNDFGQWFAVFKTYKNPKLSQVEQKVIFCPICSVVAPRLKLTKAYSSSVMAMIMGKIKKNKM